jgi:hypothetical protein
MVLGAGSLLFAFLAWRSSQRSVQVSEDQLKLAREQAALRPEVVVSEMQLIGLREARSP